MNIDIHRVTNIKLERHPLRVEGKDVDTVRVRVVDEDGTSTVITCYGRDIRVEASV